MQCVFCFQEKALNSDTEEDDSKLFNKKLKSSSSNPQKEIEPHTNETAKQKQKQNINSETTVNVTVQNRERAEKLKEEVSGFLFY